ncbi:MMPL family transporter [Paenibacillus allorhizosphaerae]|uniref:Trehalose monomycolate exporter MmpL3 n=1 Tax=Paenibacillus allorhizosphaerae TaxID=2849866 RepID=A0ABM8VB52_9BACL|nr:MMPL family transporter [Paenibacillus allorhizosphaerae]CAG7616716.1 Trehalose monomycolate exporter MmpL3 [Paenibacillus allorhizosphaerae]
MMEQSLFAALGRTAAKRRWGVLLVTVLFVAFAGIWGSGALGRLAGGAGFDDPQSDSAKADVILAGPLGRYVSDVVVLYEHPDMTVDDPGFAGPVRKALTAIPADAAVRMSSYWTSGDEAFVSGDRHAGYVTLQLPSDDEQERVRQFKALKNLFQVEGLTVKFGGLTPMTEQVNAQTGRDIALAEMLSIPLLLILLVLIFRSAVAASMPLVIGVIVAVGSFAVLRSLTAIVDISTFSINVITMLGLGLAIDYALFMVSRYREELAHGLTVDDAIVRTMATAGRTVAFSGVTVAVSVACLVVFPSRFLSSMGISGMAAVLFAVLSTLIVLPALLRFAGHRINALRIPLPSMARAKAANASFDETRGRWYRTAHAVMRRPLLSTMGIVILLVALGSPFLGVNWARPGDWVLPVDADARAVTEKLRTDFQSDPARIITVVLETKESPTSPAMQGALQQYMNRLLIVEGIESAKLTGVHGNSARLTLGYSPDPQSREAARMVEQLRAETAPQGSESLFTGMPVSRVDIVEMIASRLPWMMLFVAVVSFIILFLAFGSLLLPLKSIVMNLLSLSAAFGAIKLIFQDGYFAEALQFVPVGAVDVNFPVLIVAIAFGLSMDYELFLLSRIREQWVNSGDPVESVALGVQRTAGIITNAALLLLVVVGGFIVSSITFMKMIGVGLVIAIIVDVTIVRGLLVPATMRLLGKWAWWSPGSMMRWWDRYGFREGSGALQERRSP